MIFTDFSSNGSISNASPSLHPNIESELRATRVNLFEEIERRKRAEDALGQMCNQWERISNLLSQGGLSFPATWDARNNMQLRMDSAEQFCQEVVLARFVSKAIGKGEARAETEAAAEAVIKSKNQEISRLRDRLQYYETVNHEMSHRNQEAMEIARRQRHLRKTRQSRIWSCIGLSVAIGASVLACSYLPLTSKHPLMTSNDFSDASSSLQESGNVNPGLIW
ncbi:hypothetical protein HHK36_012116 [Tetracentron sinense]|uniref:Uncharacterized protein n=1 Tax=Tetracentron sinense TaxID=13715 RepID=A0A834Z8E4_TETSI|nr:hypothetical protein HHK36_012116 [Tetracentron sinense]